MSEQQLYPLLKDTYNPSGNKALAMLEWLENRRPIRQPFADSTDELS